MRMRKNQQTTISFTVLSVGRKWLQINLNNSRKARLFITAETGMLVAGDEVDSITVVDISTCNYPRAVPTFRPLIGHSARPHDEALRRMAEAKAEIKARSIIKKWLPRARADIESGVCDSTAISIIFGSAFPIYISDLSRYIDEKELADLSARIEQNRIAEEEYCKEQARKLEIEQQAIDEQARLAAAKARRHLILSTHIPPMGVPVKTSDGLWVVYERRDCSFRAYEDIWCTYCYYRPATEAEIAAASKSPAE